MFQITVRLYHLNIKKKKFHWLQLNVTVFLIEFSFVSRKNSLFLQIEYVTSLNKKLLHYIFYKIHQKFMMYECAKEWLL